jgi:hypothetical protein
MAEFSVSKFREELGVGSRPNLFKVIVTGPRSTGYDLKNFEYLCRSGSLPSATLGTIEIPMNGGRRLKMGGDRTFAEWTSTVLNDENFKLRSVMESWQNDIVKTNYEITASLGNRSAAIGAPSAAVASTAAATVGGLYGTVEIFQLKEDGSSVKGGSYKLINCWPSDISQIDLSYDTTDAVEDFTVTWTYDYFENGFIGDTTQTVQTSA